MLFIIMNISSASHYCTEAAACQAGTSTPFPLPETLLDEAKAEVSFDLEFGVFAGYEGILFGPGAEGMALEIIDELADGVCAPGADVAGNVAVEVACCG